MEPSFYFLSQVEFMLALICLASVIAIGQVGKSLLIMTSVIVIKNLVDNLAKIQIRALEGEFNILTSTWHGSFILSYAVAIFSIYILHRQTHTPFTLYCRFYLSATMLAMTLHLGILLEQIYTDHLWLLPVYQFGIPFINYSCMFALMFGLYKVYRRRQEFGERINWTS